MKGGNDNQFYLFCVLAHCFICLSSAKSQSNTKINNCRMVLVVDYVLALWCLCFNIRIKHKVNVWIWSCFIFCIKSFIPVILKTFLNCFSQFHELDGLENSVLHPGDTVVRVQKLIQTPMVWIGSGGLIRVGDCPDMLKEIKGRTCFDCTYCSSYSTMYFVLMAEFVQ